VDHPQPAVTPANPSRRPVDLSSLDEHARLLKPKAGIPRDDSRRKSVTVPKDALVPVIQAEVGSTVSVDVYRYRLLLPVAQIIGQTAESAQRVVVAHEDDLDTIQNTFIRHFGGVTVHRQQPSPIRGVGARDPADVVGTLESNEHAVYEVYAAPIHASDEYFRAVRRELEDALGEGVILIERQFVTLI
jgi:hypothetical protein